MLYLKKHRSIMSTALKTTSIWNFQKRSLFLLFFFIIVCIIIFLRTGHSSAIRDIYVAENEHYFLSASRDKSVKLWLLKNHGNGTAHLGCSGTYEGHDRAVFSVQGLEAKRVVASCDGEIHVSILAIGHRQNFWDNKKRQQFWRWWKLCATKS